jgi:presenilin-like A22 family membrane protease
MILLLVLAVYDFLAVRFGYMLWMVKKLSNSTSLPAFVLPRVVSEWKESLRGSNVTKLLDQKPEDREYAILGGGDIGFPLLLISSAYFAYGFASAGFLAGFALVGLIGAFVIQSVFQKGKAVPGLPPIAAFCLVGLLILRFVQL